MLLTEHLLSFGEAFPDRIREVELFIPDPAIEKKHYFYGLNSNA